MRPSRSGLSGARGPTTGNCAALSACALFVNCAALSACAPETDRPTASARFYAELPPSLLEVTELRYAVLWRVGTPARVVVSTDAPVLERGTRFEVAFTPPGTSDLSRFHAPEILGFEDGSALAAVRPRVIVYRDDGDRRFSFADPEDAHGDAGSGDAGSGDAGSGARDVSLALDHALGGAVTFIGDARRAVGKLGPQAARQYYAHTGDRLTPFVVTDAYAANGLLRLRPQFDSLYLYEDHEVRLREDVACGRALTSVTVPLEKRVFVDRRLGAEAVCPLIETECSELDLEVLPESTVERILALDEYAELVAAWRAAGTNLDAGAKAERAAELDASSGNTPDSGVNRADASPLDAALGIDASPLDAALGIDASPLDAAPGIDASPLDAALGADASSGDADSGGPPAPPTPSAEALVQCRRDGDYAALLILEPPELRCQACVCVQHTLEHVYISDPYLPPSWWPCGDTIPYCSSGALSTLSASCALDSGERDLQSESRTPR